MPKFIGRNLDCERIHDNAVSPEGYVRLTYTQALRLDSSDLLKSLDTTDKGSRGTLAKRWYRWFGRIEEIKKNPKSTGKMLEYVL